MRILVMGGTSFLGRHVALEALHRGDEVTTFNRGRTGPDVDGVEVVRGDRSEDADLAQLAGRSFDAVVDTGAQVPRDALRSARLLSDTVGCYVVVTSISVYAERPGATSPLTEASALVEGSTADGPDDGDYARLKAGVELAVREAVGTERSVIVRAGLLLGPHENVWRMPWWLQRMARGGEVLAPGDPSLPMQLVDARDVAVWMLDQAAAGGAGTYNVTAPPGNTTMGEWLGLCRDVCGSDARLTWVDDAVLVQHGVGPWTELPLWLPAGPDRDHLWDVDVSRALATGLRARPIAETVRDTWAWLRDAADLPHPAQPRGALGIDLGKERRILDAWHAVAGSGA